jgi:hypothetical protein
VKPETLQSILRLADNVSSPSADPSQDGLTSRPGLSSHKSDLSGGSDVEINVNSDRQAFSSNESVKVIDAMGAGQNDAGKIDIGGLCCEVLFETSCSENFGTKTFSIYLTKYSVRVPYRFTGFTYRVRAIYMRNTLNCDLDIEEQQYCVSQCRVVNRDWRLFCGVSFQFRAGNQFQWRALN